MTLTVDMAWVLGTLLVATRIAAALALAPVLGPTQIPGTVRVVLAMSLGGLILAGLAPSSGPVVAAPVDDLAGLGAALVGEVLIGAAFAFGFLVAYAATQFAGRALDIQAGFSAAAVLNPATQGFSPLIGSLFGMAAIMVFLALDGHHVLIRALALSLEAMPPGTGFSGPGWEAFWRHSSLMFTAGLALAAPVMFALFLADIALAVMSRSMPQLNVFILSFAVKVVLAMVGLALSIRYAESALVMVFSQVFEFWGGLAAPASP
jgi:flagellar biosynthetic protein FliR